MLSTNDILNALRHVEDPDLKQDLVSLNMIKDLRLEGGRVCFTVELTTPACPMKDAIQHACITAIHTLVDPGLQVEVTMGARVRAAQADPNSLLPQVKNLIAVGSGKGGVGKSTVAANLAVALAQAGSRVGLVDADIYGPSVPMLFGLVDQRPYLVQVDGQEKMEPILQHGVYVMSIGFLVEADKSIVWRGPMASNSLRQLITDTAWPELDYLIVDLPPGTGDIHITISQQFPLSGAVIVTTPQAVAVADARKAAGMFLSPHIQVPLLGVIENMSWFETEELPGRRFQLFGSGGGQQVAAEFGAPLLGQIPIVESIRATSDAGVPVAQDPAHPWYPHFRALAGELARQISILNAQKIPA
ncbi:MAG: Mrp/NBP35 family ATP-binding protein [Bacteroidetes bacterium]|jgi:ATP-binding protein involved in chromosome partitioning|nr:Mrp/NBP35 family ATP-binding protein [Bacteroidota bacterium]